MLPTDPVSGIPLSRCHAEVPYNVIVNLPGAVSAAVSGWSSHYI